MGALQEAAVHSTLRGSNHKLLYLVRVCSLVQGIIPLTQPVLHSYPLPFKDTSVPCRMRPLSTPAPIFPIVFPCLRCVSGSCEDQAVVAPVASSFSHPIYYPRTTLALPPSSSSITQIRGQLSRLFSPLPTTVRAFIFIARIMHHFLPSSARVESYRPTAA